MTITTNIQLDAVLAYLQAATGKTYRSFCLTHGKAFAQHFVDEYREQVMNAARMRLCGHSEDWLLSELARLKSETNID